MITLLNVLIVMCHCYHDYLLVVCVDLCHICHDYPVEGIDRAVSQLSWVPS